ncbi:helix-turn-helix transcriptional regulator [Mycobacterium nebraskense]|uniref:helix-turn-helix transcriptional regulator n=1 Tax=Mycobacterium nebraskense TaxID=244292 RepID=UPI003C6D41D0
MTTMETTTHDRWLSRQELADRYGLPVKTPAGWASKGKGPRYAKFGKHVRYRLSDVLAWERQQFADRDRNSA